MPALISAQKKLRTPSTTTGSSIKRSYNYGTAWKAQRWKPCASPAARDILAYAMLALEDAGFNLVLTAHDEIIAESKDPNRQANFERLMATPLRWATGCPVAVEGQAMRR
jgi:DNA polymerase